MSELRNYKIDTPQYDFYKKMHEKVDLEYTLKMKKKYGKYDKCKMTIKKALSMMDDFIDPSDPDLDVPDLDVPFLGVHFTPTADLIPKINIGPTATLALGRENYANFKNIEPISSVFNVMLLAKQYFYNKAINEKRAYISIMSGLIAGFLIFP